MLQLLRREGLDPLDPDAAARLWRRRKIKRKREGIAGTYVISVVMVMVGNFFT
jgi:hypothetical protein